MFLKSGQITDNLIKSTLLLSNLDFIFRAGYIVEDFQNLLDKIENSVTNPSKFSVERKKTVDKYIDYLGEDSRNAILREFRRFFISEGV